MPSTQPLRIVVNKAKLRNINPRFLQFYWETENGVRGDIHTCFEEAGKGDPNAIIVAKAIDLFDEGRIKFIEGFDSCAPSWYDSSKDSSGNPWCAPWVWDTEEEWFIPTMTPYAMGQRWAGIVKDRMEFYHSHGIRNI